MVDCKGRSIHESLVVVEYLDNLARQSAERQGKLCTFQPLVPQDPMEQAQSRLDADWVNRDLCSPYYKMLVRTDPGEQREAFDGFLEALGRFQSKMTGPFFYGSRISHVDVALLPWAQRFYILEYYRSFVIPPKMDKYHRWLEACRALPAVAATTPDRADYLRHIGRYADASARSKVANAVRSGRTAHEIDHRVD